MEQIMCAVIYTQQIHENQEFCYKGLRFSSDPIILKPERERWRKEKKMNMEKMEIDEHEKVKMVEDEQEKVKVQVNRELVPSRSIFY